MNPSKEDRLVDAAEAGIKRNASETDPDVWAEHLATVWVDVLTIARDDRIDELVPDLELPKTKANIGDLFSQLASGNFRVTPIGQKIITDAAFLAGADVAAVREAARAIASGNVMPAITAGEQLAASIVARLIGGKVTKTWETVGDDKVRPAHNSAEGQEVLEHEFFNVGGEDLYYPRDVGGSAGNVINCRCTAPSRVFVPAGRR